MRALWVLYDDGCGFCCRCAEWLREQPTYLPMGVMPAFSPYEKNELVVIDDEGGVYQGTAAWLMTLWALREWREWSTRLSSAEAQPLARKVVELAGTWRHGLTRIFRLSSEAELRRELEVLPESPHCDGDACALPACRSCGVSTHLVSRSVRSASPPHLALADRRSPGRSTIARALGLSLPGTRVGERVR